MSRKRVLGLSLAVVAAMSLSLVAVADDGVFADGSYSLTLPGLTAIEFDVATDGDDTTVTATAVPDGFERLTRATAKSRSKTRVLS